MTNYQKFNQNEYLPNLTHINSLLSPKNKQLLEQFNLITISYYYYPISNHKTRTISLQLSNFQDFNILLNKYKKVTSNPNYNFTHFFKPTTK